MNIWQVFRMVVIGFFCMMVFLNTGCATPDHWPVFKDPGMTAGSEDSSLSTLAGGSVFKPESRSFDDPLVEISESADCLDLTIEQTAMMALKNNSELKVALISPAIAGTFAEIERGVYDPEVFAEMNYYEEKASETSRATGEAFGVQGSDIEMIAGVRQKLPFGTTLEAAVTHERNLSNRAPDQQTARAGLSITQSLLRGFGPAVNLARVQQAELDVMASTYELQGFIESLLADSEIAYWRYVLANQEIAIFEKSLAVVKQQRDEIEQKIEVGTLPRTEAAAARAQVADHEQALIEARSILSEKRLRLLQIITQGSDDRLDLDVNAISDPFETAEPVTDLADRIELARRSRPDLNEARLRVRQGRLETLMTRNGLLPRLELFMALGRTGYADNFSGAFQRMDENTYDFSAGIRMSHYAGNRAAEAQNRAAQLSVRQKEAVLSNLTRIIEVDVRLSVNEVERTRQQITAGKATRMLQEEKYQAEKERFEVGSSTSLLVAQAYRDLLVSQIAEVRAVVNYRIARVNLYLTEGSLLERRGIRVD